MKKNIIKRNNDIDTIIELINNREDYKENSENGLVILLNGQWGTGKITFIEQLNKRIKDEENIELLGVYNSYKYDFYDNAYIPLFSELEDTLSLKGDLNKLIECTSKNAINGLINISLNISKGVLKNKLGIDLSDINDLSTLNNNKDYYENFKEFKRISDLIKKRMNEICKDKVHVFVIDELDRCKPNFAVETLEIIKHLFDVKNCVFIIAVDKIQLIESIKTIYGEGMDTEKYFSKFYDYLYNLLPLSFKDVIDVTEIKEYEGIVSRISNVFEYLRVSTRDSKKIFNEFISKYKRLGKEWTGNQSLFVIFLLTLKYVDLLFYNEIINGNYEKHKEKILSDHSPLANDYRKILDIKIGNGISFNKVLSNISTNIKMEYVDPTIKRYNWDDEENLIQKQKEAVAREIIYYLPRTLNDKSIKENIINLIDN